MSRIPTIANRESPWLHLLLALAFLLVTLLLPTAARSDAESDLRDRILACRERGDFVGAAARAESLISVMRSKPLTPSGDIGLIEADLRGYNAEAALPESVRLELARAERLNPEMLHLWAVGEWPRMESLATIQLAIRRRLLPRVHPQVAASVNMAACGLSYQSRWVEAEPLFHEAALLQEQLLGHDHPRYAGALANWGAALWCTGHQALGERLYAEVFAIYRRVGAEDTEAYASDMADLGLFHFRRGDLSGAEALLREATARNPCAVVPQRTLETVLRMQGNAEEAVSIARDYYGKARADLDEGDSAYQWGLSNLGTALCAAGDPAAGEPYLRDVLELALDEHGSISAAAVNAEFELAGCLSSQARYASADSLYRECLYVTRQITEVRDQDYAAVLTDYALMLHEMGRYADEERTASEAVSILHTLPAPDPHNLIHALYRLGLAELAERRYSASEIPLMEAASLYERERRGVDRSLRRATFKIPSSYAPLAAARMEMGQGAAGWESAEHAQARGLNDLMRSTPGAIGNDNAAGPDSLELQVLESRMDVESISPASGDSTAARRREDAMTRLRWAESKAAAARARRTSARPDSGIQTFPLGRVQAALGPETALIGWIDVEERKGEWGSWGYVIRKHGSVRWTRLGSVPAAPDTLSPVRRSWDFREALTSGPDLLGEESPLVQARARMLWRERIRPLEPVLEGIRRLVVIPSGAMLGVPVEALEDDSGAPLCARYVVSYSPSATVFARLRERGRARPMRESAILLVGDPAISTASTADPSWIGHEAAPAHEWDIAASRRSPKSRRIEILRGALHGDRASLNDLPALPASRDEIWKIASVCRPSTILVGKDASEEVLTRLADEGQLSRYATIHLATHALIDDDQPERSALILSQVRAAGSPNAAVSGGPACDGLLRAEEIALRWKLDADLVTLSACETALGREAGGEGYIGLCHAFLQAGAHSLLVSLWKVDDGATALLMQRFYEDRAGVHGPPMDKAAALREAKLYVRSYDEGGERPYEHPFYWAGFILFGDAGDAGAMGHGDTRVASEEHP
jgi:CHAT domain-containing protein/tetratricopeptide (TPR) repeat protein